MSIQIYTNAEEIQMLQKMMQIREAMTRIEAPTRGSLSKLSEEQYDLYVKYLDMLHLTADQLEEIKNETPTN
jgi:arginyl-tRNA--protein-N-Asp/Glu arginylyltransferase